MAKKTFVTFFIKQSPYLRITQEDSIMNINQIKEHYTCLDYLGKPLKKTRAGWYVYRCPWKEDKHPSLNVSPNGKVWHDLTTGAKGGIIELVMTCLNTKELARVCAEFDFSSFLMPRIIDNEKKEEVQGTAFHFFSLVPLQSRGLYAYLSKRCINTHIARQFLQEAHYSFQPREDDKYLYALAYPNDKGGYELRGGAYTGIPDGFKGCTSPKGITTHLDKENVPTVVFEGFMDMLSFATMCGEVRHNYIVLNSIVNADAAIKVLRSMGNKVLLCLDNDDGGERTTRKILEALPSAIDIRNRFAPAKDVNEYLCSLSNTRPR